MADEPCGVFEFDIESFNASTNQEGVVSAKRKRGRRGGKKHAKKKSPENEPLIPVEKSSDGNTKAPWHRLSEHEQKQEEREQTRERLRARIRAKTRSRQRSGAVIDGQEEEHNSIAMARQYMASSEASKTLNHGTLEKLARQHGLDPSMLNGLSRRKMKRRLERVKENEVAKVSSVNK